MPKRILVIDDEPDVLIFISSVLEDNGFEPVTTSSGFEAIQLARSERPDLILLDLIMPGKSGLTLFQELKTDPSLSSIPVVVVTGVSQITGADFKDFAFRKKGTGTGVDPEGSYVAPEGFIEKPIDPKELIRVIESLT